jgi:hypothetical protein
MKKRNKTYLLFMYGLWSDERMIIRTAQEFLLPIVESGFLKFMHGPGSSIVSFKSKETLEDLDAYLSEHIPDFVLNYFFMVKPRKMGYRLPGGLEEHIFNLDKDTSRVIQSNEIKIDEYENLDEVDKELYDIVKKVDDIFDDFLKDIPNNIIEEAASVFLNEDEFEEYSVDSILDKIAEKGIDSLTEREKNFLDQNRNQ